MQYDENFVLSAMAPETMVAAVAQKTVWKMKVHSAGTLLSEPMKPKPSQPKKALPAPYMMLKPSIQYSTEPHMKSTKFFIRMLAVFLACVRPASTRAKPGCIQNTSIAPSNTHIVSSPFTKSFDSSTAGATISNNVIIIKTIPRPLRFALRQKPIEGAALPVGGYVAVVNKTLPAFAWEGFLLLVSQYGVTILTGTDAPYIEHITHEDSSVTYATRVGHLENHLHGGIDKHLAAYDGDLHTLYHICAILHTAVHSLLTALADTMYGVVLKPVDVAAQQRFLDLFKFGLADNCFNLFHTQKLLVCCELHYLYMIFSNQRLSIESPNVIYCKPRLDIRNIMQIEKGRGYGIQLSDTEGDCLFTKECGAIGLPVIVTPIPSLFEQGIKDKENAYVLDYNMKDIPYEEIFNNIPKVEPRKVKDNWDKVLTQNKSTYKEETKKKYKVEATDMYTRLGLKDNELGRIPEKGEQWDVSYERMLLLTGENKKNIVYVKLID